MNKRVTRSCKKKWGKNKIKQLKSTHWMNVCPPRAIWERDHHIHINCVLRRHERILLFFSFPSLPNLFGNWVENRLDARWFSSNPGKTLNPASSWSQHKNYSFIFPFFVFNLPHLLSSFPETKPLEPFRFATFVHHARHVSTWHAQLGTLFFTKLVGAHP